MKKLILTIITLSIIAFNGCYDPDTATVRINLGNMPLAKHEPKSFIDKVLGLFEKEVYAAPLSDYVSVSKVYIAAVSGDSVIVSACFDSDDIDAVYSNYASCTVELNVPAGEDISIVVLGKGLDTGNATWYGVSDTYNLKPGVTQVVEMQENSFTSPAVRTIVGFTSDEILYTFNWNKMPGASEYILVNTMGQEYVTYYQGSATVYQSNRDEIPKNLPFYSLYIKFDWADITSPEITYYQP